MNKNEISGLICQWSKENISSSFSDIDMEKNVSLLGIDSIDVVELCEYLETKLGVPVDYDWMMDFETLLDLSAGLEECIAA